MFLLYDVMQILLKCIISELAACRRLHADLQMCAAGERIASKRKSCSARLSGYTIHAVLLFTSTEKLLPE